MAPTLLDAVGIQAPASWAGLSLSRAAGHRAAAVDGFDMTGLVGMFNGRKLLVRCNIGSGATTVDAIDGPPFDQGQAPIVRQEAARLYAGLARRYDADRCFDTAANY